MEKRNYALLFIGSILSVFGLLISIKYIMKYFTIKELTTTNTGLPNVPNDTQKAALETLVKNVLDPARELLKSAISVNSGFRSPEVNKAIGGATNSQHLKGEAADLNCSDKAKLFSLIRNNLPFDQKQLGNILSQNDIITADMEFFEIPSKYIVGLPSKITYNNIYEREAIIDSLSGNVTSITQFGDSGFDRITDFQYDNLGNITKIIYPEAQSGRKNITIKYDKKHIITDTNGLLLAVVVHAANEYDGKKAFDVIETLNRFERMQKIYADGGYRGDELAEKLKKELNYDLKITLRSDKETDFKPLPKRWVIERNFAWFNGYRRLSKDDEKLTETSEAMIMITCICLMLNNKIFN